MVLVILMKAFQDSISNDIGILSVKDLNQFCSPYDVTENFFLQGKSAQALLFAPFVKTDLTTPQKKFTRS